MHYEIFIPAIFLFLIAAPFRCKKYNLNILKSILLVAAFIAIAVAGTKLLFILENLRLVKKNGLEWKSGFSLFGSFFTTLTIFPLIGLLFKLKRNESLDIASVLIAPMIAFFRINCYLQGCCGSKVFYNAAGNAYTVPLQLIEVGYVLIITILLIILETKHFFKNYLFNIFLITYCIYRFVIEFFRDNPTFLLGLSIAQIHSIILVLLSIILIAINFTKIKENNEIAYKEYKRAKKLKQYKKANN